MKPKEIFENGLEEFKASIIANFDELNVLKGQGNVEADIASPKNSTQETFLDDFLEYLITAYEDGNIVARDMLGKDFNADEDKLNEALELKVADKDYRQRVLEYVDSGDLESLMRVADTEYHRMFNTGIYDAGITHGATYKTWKTMLDDKVRESHSYLENIRVPIDEKFYTYDDDSALYPNGFEKAENNVNCRCYITIE